ncbi:hypothetical protein NHX12_018405 [Muraenolepis orangiensis]|uniref:Interleukin-2 receptor subunit beta N-terminal domain-containing protein n=1 Tax=Muraenolepis orangiensis TaxID=630683 RepID=A0A9Q0EWR0_9TELE|nr:hypothetical protein NHX12_018405 [Muraenolepis orangiensis]
MFNMSCDLRPLDLRPPLRACTLVSADPEVFSVQDMWKISLVCESVASIPVTSFKPADHNELELGRGRSYQAHSRIRPHLGPKYQSMWSDWSPVVSWVLPVGTEESLAPGRPAGVQWVTAAVGVLVVLSLAVIVCKTDRESWVYMVKKIRGPPLPNPAQFLRPDGKSQVWLKTGFTCESHHTLTRLDAISPVEVTDPWSAPPEKQTPRATSSSYCNPSYAPLPLLPRLPALSFSPLPSLSSNPLLPLLHPRGNLEPCDADSPYGPMGMGEETTGEPEPEDDENPGEDRGDRGRWSADLLHMISGGCVGSTGSMAVCPDYQKVGDVGAQRSPDPAVGCSGDGGEGEGGGKGGGGSQTNDGSPGSESREKAGGQSHVEKLLSREGGITLGQGSLEVCLDYEKVRSLEVYLDYEKVRSLEVCLDYEKVRSLEVCLDYEKLRSLEEQPCRAQRPDSGIGSGGEELVSQGESLEDVDFPLWNKAFTLPLLSDRELQHSQRSFINPHVLFPGQGQPGSPFPFNLGAGAASTTSTMLPSGGAYMPSKS